DRPQGQSTLSRLPASAAPPAKAIRGAVPPHPVHRQHASATEGSQQTPREPVPRTLGFFLISFGALPSLGGFCCLFLGLCSGGFLAAFCRLPLLTGRVRWLRLCALLGKPQRTDNSQHDQNRQPSAAREGCRESGRRHWSNPQGKRLVLEPHILNSQVKK